MGRTKHAESCPRSLPAFISVGELGINSKLDIISKKSLVVFLTSALLSYNKSASASVLATRRIISPGVSIGLPSASFLRYLRSSTVFAFSEIFRSPIDLISIVALPCSIFDCILFSMSSNDTWRVSFCQIPKSFC